MDWKEIDRLVNWHRDALREAYKASEILADEVRRQQQLIRSFAEHVSRSLVEVEQGISLLPDLSATLGDVYRVVDAYEAAVALPAEELASASRAELDKIIGVVNHAPWQQMAEAVISATNSVETFRAFESTFQGQLLSMTARFEASETPEEAESVLVQLAASIIAVIRSAPVSARAALWNLVVGIIYPLLLYLAAQASGRQEFERIHARLAAVEEEIRDELSACSDALPHGADHREVAFLTREETYVYVDPDGGSQQVASLPMNAAVTKLDQSGEWAQVEFFVYPLASPTTGWVRADVLRTVPE